MDDPQPENDEIPVSQIGREHDSHQTRLSLPRSWLVLTSSVSAPEASSNFDTGNHIHLLQLGENC